MHASPLAWSLVVLSAGLALGQTPQEKPRKRVRAPEEQQAKGQKKAKPGKDAETQQPITIDEGDVARPGQWDPEFDYTNLPPPNEVYWEDLATVEVELEEALHVAAEALGGPVWLRRGELATHADAPAWHLELFAGAKADEAPRRVDLVVSAAAPEVLQRSEPVALTPADAAIWNALGRAEVQAEAVVNICKTRSHGVKTEPEVTNPRVRKLAFVAASDASQWECELMGVEKELPRRWAYEVKPDKPRVKQKLMLDRFSGEPLRAGQPVQLENGMYVFDFVVGDGPVLTKDSKVKVNYRLFLLDNLKLHDTIRYNQPETFVVSQAPLRGMTEGMIGMRVGGKRKLAIPYELAFGEQGNEIAPPRAMVVCDVRIEELVSQ